MSAPCDDRPPFASCDQIPVTFTCALSNKPLQTDGKALD